MSSGNPNPQLAFDHIGIVTKDVDAGARALAASLGAVGFTERFDDEQLGVSVRFVRDAANVTYELIAPLGDNSPVARVLASKANLLNQVAYRTTSLIESAMKFRDNGNLALGEPKPAKAFGGAKVQFFWCPLGFVIELIEESQHAHAFRPNP